MKAMLGVAAMAAMVWSGAAMARDVASVRLAEPGNAPPSVFLYAQKMKLPKPVGQPVKPAEIGQALQAGPQAARPTATPRLLPGSTGGKVLAPIQIVPDTDARNAPAAAQPQAVGEAGFPFATSRIELMNGQMSAQYPNRAVGRLGFRYKTGNAMCSASLIGPGLLLTAAHCVAEFGSGGFLPNANWAYVPGYYKGKGAYGTFTAQAAFAPQSYVNGTAQCLQGVICPNDVALLVLRPNKKKKYPGSLTGWLGVGLDGYGFSDWLAAPVAPVAQLGYPGGLDNGAQMIRNDSFGIRLMIGDSDAGETPVENTVIGSVLDGGSSGGPWVVNFGVPPSYGTIPTPMMATPNTVVGVTSWGDDTGEFAFVGASTFTTGVLGALMTEACGQYPAACGQ